MTTQPTTESVRIRRDLLDAVREVAEKEFRPISSQLHLIIEAWLAQQRRDGQQR